MKPVTVGRYDAAAEVKPPESTGQSTYWLGWVSTEDWAVWEGADGKLYVCNGCGPSGAVLADPVVVDRVR